MVYGSTGNTRGTPRPSATPMRFPRNPAVLIVEDDRRLASRMSRVLKAEGYACHVVRTCRDALASCAEHKPYYAVVGAGLPGMTGPELADQIGAHSPATYVTLMISAAEAPSVLRSASACDFITKPFTD